MFDSGTFTRPKKIMASPGRGEGDQHYEVPSVPNAEDIENLAKQQEESRLAQLENDHHHHLII